MEANILAHKVQSPLGKSAYIAPQGHFGITTEDEFKLYKCRETFHRKINSLVRNNGYYFTHPDNLGSHVAKCIYVLETHLDIDPLSSFQHTDVPWGTWINLSPWWKAQKIRHQFFTIALRASLNIRSVNGCPTITRENIIEQLPMSELYFRWTSTAARRFLSGYTKCPSDCAIGWVQMFSSEDYSRSQIESKLTKPEKDHNKISCIARRLWEQEGCPSGKEKEHWAYAQVLA